MWEGKDGRCDGPTLRAGALGVALALLLIAPASAPAAARVLPTSNDGVLSGARDERVGITVGLPGDVNGDGHPDLMTTATAPSTGRSYVAVAYGQTWPATLTTADIAQPRGFRIYAPGFDDILSAAPAGDVNGDGRADLLVATRTDVGDRPQAGVVFVVFGDATGGDLELEGLLAGTSTRGFRIVGPRRYAYAGTSVAAAGDVDGDGLGDVVIGAPAGEDPRGAAYVVRGKSTTSPVDLAALAGAAPSHGFEIAGAAFDDDFGASVAAAGDVDADGHADVLVGAPLTAPAGVGTGSVYLIRGRASSATVDLASATLGPGAAGWRIDGPAPSARLGDAVAGAPDLDGDGTPDLLLGAPSHDVSGDDNAGVAYAVFLDRDRAVTSLGGTTWRGVRFDGPDSRSGAGSALAVSADRDGDHLPEMVIGAPFADLNGTDSGAAFVVPVDPHGGVLALASAPLRLLGASTGRIGIGDEAGMAVAAGDLDGTGGRDILVGAPIAVVGPEGAGGAAFAVLGTTSPAAPPPGPTASSPPGPTASSPPRPIHPVPAPTPAIAGPRVDTAISQAPRPYVATRRPTISFTASQAGATFRCAVDVAAMTPCTSPLRLASLKEGPHRFRVAAVGPNGIADNLPATADFTVDVTRPRARIDRPRCGHGTKLRLVVADRSPLAAGSATVGGGRARAFHAKHFSLTRRGQAPWRVAVRITDAAGNRLRRTIVVPGCRR